MKTKEIKKLINESLGELNKVDSFEIGGVRQFHLHAAIGKLNCIANGLSTGSGQLTKPDVIKSVCEMCGSEELQSDNLCKKCYDSLP